MLNFPQIKFLKSLVCLGPGKRSMGAHAQYFQEHHRLGVPFGRLGASIEYGEQDIEDARNILTSLRIEMFPNGLSQSDIDENIGANDAPCKSDRSSGSSMPGISEKSGTVGPRDGEIAFRGASPGCMLDGESIPFRLSGYLSTHFSDFARIEAHAILVVENLETFKQLHRYRWMYEHVLFSRPVVAIYRGDNIHKNDNVMRALTSSALKDVPVWSFPDFDPAGVGFSSQLPNFSGLILPAQELESLARKRNLRALFEDQVGQWSGVLEKAQHPDIKKAWEMLKRLRMGVNQEFFRDI